MSMDALEYDNLGKGGRFFPQGGELPLLSCYLRVNSDSSSPSPPPLSQPLFHRSHHPQYGKMLLVTRTNTEE